MTRYISVGEQSGAVEWAEKRVNRLDDGGLLKIHHFDVIKMIAPCK